MPNELTKMDIVKTEHDLTCYIIEKMQIAQERGLDIKQDWNLGYIAGVTEMANNLIEIMEDENDEEAE